MGKKNEKGETSVTNAIRKKRRICVEEERNKRTGDYI